MKNLIHFIIISCILTFPAYAENPENKTAELRQIEEKVNKEKEQQELLKTKALKLESDMQTLKKKLLNSTTKVQKHENNLRNIEENLAKITTEKEAHIKDLTQDKKSLAELILALERIKRLPPETLVAKPDAPLETAQAAIVLRSILPEINRRAEKLKIKLNELKSIEDKLKIDQDKLISAAKELKIEQDKMNGLILDRSKTLASTKAEVSEKAQKIASLSKQAKDFRELIAAIKKRQDEEREAKRKAKRNNDRINSYQNDNNLPALGTGRPPVSGTVKTRYGQTDDIGAKSQGITFAARDGAVVIAPLGGVVRYAGDFRNYGKIVLLEHKNKFHSLVAGLGKVDTFVGQHVDAGEPIGALPLNSGKLYYELRKQGEPVNPSQKFNNLN